ncbi:CRISPR type III-A/MTUBE-associated RAMP protein Csm5 [Deinococcus reticulitermitis]|uniref:CRISPR system Cms protein Csm5 n=1 Tax=Deinococcus reticulitermitis TaxID=856736 RepID=A0A1H7CUK1_9DEIO|nr:type III-A CRISPR-associated RAMP protein Csm5 [Deinococcus reticulitermitis]SEJ92874.1 CRISPR type III-A/MTUBE-associated RAMP protein Csm5 [Deinococcus reticulitermitis]
MTPGFRPGLQRRQLKFRISVKPMSPVHIGVGSEVLGRGAYHLYEQGRHPQLAIVSPRPLAARLLDQFGEQANFAATIRQRMKADDYPPNIAREIESGPLALRRMSVHPGALPHLKDEGRNGGLKVATALGNGLPYIPGSSVKGALRTAWLDWQVGQKGAYDRFLREVRQANPRGRDRADDVMMERKQIAEGLTGARGRMQPQNRDLFRAVQVSDLIPDRSENLTRAYAVLSMSYDQQSGYARPSNGGKAGAQAWECLNPEAGATYLGTVTVDLELLARMQTTDLDARNLMGGLGKAEVWQDALAGYGSRVYGTEEQHYNDVLAELPQQEREGIQLWGEGGLVLDWMLDAQQEERAERLFPLGMGTGLLVHSLLGALPPEDREDLAFLGDEPGQGGETLLKNVLDTGLRRSPEAYFNPEFPAPKSRRVVGQFQGRRYNEMRAERPLGWTEVRLEPTH